MSDLGPEEEHPAGSVLFRQGHRPVVVSLIVGDVSLVKKVRVEANGEEAIVGLRGAGWLLGAAPASLGLDYVSSAVAAATCRLRSMPAEAFRRILDAHAEVTAWVGRMFARLDREHEAARAELLVYPAPERFARLLKRFVDLFRPPRHGGWIRLGLPLTREEIAQLIGVSREYLYEIVASRKDAGVLRDGHGQWLLLEKYWVEKWREME